MKLRDRLRWESKTRQAIRKAGGPTVVGRALGISRQAVHQWRIVPHQYLTQVAAMANMPERDIRSDFEGDT